MSLVRVSSSVSRYDKWMGTSPYAGAWRGAKLGQRYADWLSKGKFSGYLSGRLKPYGGVAYSAGGYVGSAQRVTGSASRLTGSAPVGEERAIQIMGDLPSGRVHRRKTSRIY